MNHGDPMKPENIYKLILTGCILLAVLACNLTFTNEFPTLTALAPTATAAILSSPLPPTQQVILSSVLIQEDNPNPSYQIKVEIPTFQGDMDARVVDFNTAMTNLVNAEIDEFKKNVAELGDNTVSPNSFFDGKHSLILQSGNLWSFKFDFSVYIAGAAHPYSYSLTVNYDLGQGRQLALGDLFLSKSSYLEVISNYCITELNKREIGFDVLSEGATPTLENYRNWNITNEGLMITFDQYQVVAGAAGSQTVIVPYSELGAVIDPQGPLAGIIP